MELKTHVEAEEGKPEDPIDPDDNHRRQEIRLDRIREQSAPDAQVIVHPEGRIDREAIGQKKSNPFDLTRHGEPSIVPCVF